MQFLTNTNLDFVGKRKAAAVLSALIILAGIGSLVVRGGPNLSIDFRGGALAEIHTEPAIGVGEARNALTKAGIDVQGLQEFGEPGELLVYVPASPEQGVESDASRVRTELAAAFPDRTIELRRQEGVGPKIGGELRSAALNAIFLALVLIIVYITFRFVFQFGVAAVVALAHDVLITIGIFSLMNKEISLTVLAAFLTIIGYSLNDTIVVFDRIRENMGLRRKESYEAVINKSINETLSRTLITSLTTLFVAAILFSTGGPVIHDFAFALVVGVLVGTYSSIFVASPVLIAWYHWRSSDRKRTTTTAKPKVAA